MANDEIGQPESVRTKTSGTVKLYPGEAYLEMMTALGQVLIAGIVPEKMTEPIKRSYFDTGVVKNYYLFINGIEVTDGLNHNPYATND